MALSETFLQELKDKTDLGDFAASYVNLKRRGKNLTGLCPFHNEKTPSFHIYQENGSFYCFGCNTGGDIITFVMKIENLDYMEAVKFLAQKAGMPMPEVGADDSMARLRTRILEINRETARFFHRVLYSPDGIEGLDYFKRRGLHERWIKKFGLGYAPTGGFDLVGHLRKAGYSQEELVQANVAGRSKKGNLYDRFRGRVMFPIIDLRGNVVAFGGRILTEEKPKYINTSDTPVYHKSSALFAMNFAKNTKAEQLILAEGYMDVIALHMAGFDNAIASLGTAFTEEQARIISRYKNEVIICYDSDAAGIRASQRAIPILKKTGLYVRILEVPGGKDPDEFFLKAGENGPIRFKKLLKESENDIEYALSRLQKRFDLTTSDGKEKFLEASINVLAKVLSPLTRDIYISELAKLTDVKRETIGETVGQAAKKIATIEKDKKRKRQYEISNFSNMLKSFGEDKRKNLIVSNAEEAIISYLMKNNDKISWIATIIPEEKFVTTFNRRVYKLLLGKTKSSGVTLSDFTVDFTETEMSELTRILVYHDLAAYTMEDIVKCADIILSERGFSNPDVVKETSVQDLNEYLRFLREQKTGGNV